MASTAVGPLLDTLDNLANLNGRIARPLSQLFYFIGHHSEPFAVLTCLGGNNGGVQGQQVSLLRHFIDHRDDRTDVADPFGKGGNNLGGYL